MIRRSDLCGHTYRATPCSHPAPQSHRPHCLVLVSPSSVVFSTTRYACLLTGSVTHSPQTPSAGRHTRCPAPRASRARRVRGGASPWAGVSLALLWAAWAQTPHESSPVGRRVGRCQPLAFLTVPQWITLSKCHSVLVQVCWKVASLCGRANTFIIWVNTALFFSTVFLPFCTFTSNFECIRISKLVPAVTS